MTRRARTSCARRDGAPPRGGAPRAAIAHLRRALDEPPAPPLRALILLELGSAESYVGDPDAAEHLEAALGAAPDLATRLTATFALGRVLELGGHHERAFAVLERAARDTEADAPALAVILQAALLSAASLDTSTAGQAADRVRALRERLRHAVPPTDAVYGPLALALAMRGAPASEVRDLARRALPEALAPVPEAADGPPFFYQAAAALILAEGFAEARGHLDRGLDHPQVRRSVAHTTTLTVLRAWLGLRTGAVADAEADARRALEESDGPVPTHLRLLATAVRVEALIELGRSPEAMAVAASVDPDAGAARTSATRLFLLAALTRLALSEGAATRARRLAIAAEWHARALGVDGVGVAWRPAAMLAAAADGDEHEARRLAGAELDCANRSGGPLARGRALRVAAVLRRGEDAIGRLEEAVRLLSGAGAALEHAHALAALGAARRRAGRRQGHLTRIYGKLGIASRGALAAALRQDEAPDAG